MPSHDGDTTLHMTLSTKLSIEIHDSFYIFLRELRMAILPGIEDVLLEDVLGNTVLRLSCIGSNIR